MLDYPALAAVAAVVREGSFERAARHLAVTPSAVSQRVRQLEERLGTVLVVRGTPCTATAEGEIVCRHVEAVGLLERDLVGRLPTAASAGAVRDRVTISVATTADNLATWFLDAAAAVALSTDVLLDVAVDDQDHTAGRLRRGEVLAAVTASDEPVQGCRVVALGALRYRATASPAYVERHFPAGVTASALGRAPALTFNAKDRLQARWIERAAGQAVDHPSHRIPSTQAFVDACLAGMAWGMNPAPLCDPLIAAGRLVELVPGLTVDVPLFWQERRVTGDLVPGLGRIVVAAARRVLVEDP